MKKALCWHGCDLFHHFSFNERLDAVRSSDAADARIQQPPHVHEHQTVKGDLRVFLRLLHTQTRKNTHTPLKHTRCTPDWLSGKNAIQNHLTSLASPAFCLIISNGHSLQSKIFLRSLKWESSVKLRHVLRIFKQNHDFIRWVKSKSLCACVRVCDWPGYSSSVQEAPRLCVPAHSVLRRLRLVAEISVLQGESQLQTEV